jgi:phosphate transport system substrate-binding protein
MSSYSYAIIPTSSSDSQMTTPKRQTLADYLDYGVCQGQTEMGKIGYSPLPINLVQASFDQIDKLHTADPDVDVAAEKVTSCNNPTFIAGHPTENYLAKIAPEPPACDKEGAVPCAGQGDTGQLNPGQKSTGSTSSTGSTGSTGTSSTGGVTGGGSGRGRTSGSGSNGATGSGSNGGGNSSTGASTGTHVDPNTGQVVSDSGTGGGTGNGGSGTGAQAVSNDTPLAGSQSHSTDITLGVIAGALLLGALIIPAAVGAHLSRRSGPK